MRTISDKPIINNDTTHRNPNIYGRHNIKLFQNDDLTLEMRSSYMKSHHTEKKSEFIADLDVKVGNEEDLNNDKNDSKISD